MDKNLIFDIGLHKGLDANFYLKKGFQVVGLEAVPAMCEKAAALNREFLDNGQLKIVEKALFYQSGQTAEFFVNPDKDDWGSLFQGAAEKGVGSSTKISVETISLQDLIKENGLPYYAKCDIEGGDAIFVQQLLTLPDHPQYVSVEATSADDLALLRACGYNRFQIVNQYTNPWTKAPNPAQEGNYVDTKFSHEMSGLFATDLPAAKWKDFTFTMKAFLDWYNLKDREPDLAIGWLDVHATKAA